MVSKIIPNSVTNDIKRMYKCFITIRKYYES